MVIVNNGDGSNSIHWVKDAEVLEKMQQLADDGDENYASGDGLQSRSIVFPDDFDVDAWVDKNFYGYKTIEDLEV